jgi:hypothetical protein
MSLFTTLEISLIKKLTSSVLKKWPGLANDKKQAVINYGIKLLLEKVPTSDAYTITDTDNKVVIVINKTAL